MTVEPSWRIKVDKPFHGSPYRGLLGEGIPWKDVLLEAQRAGVLTLDTRLLDVADAWKQHKNRYAVPKQPDFDVVEELWLTLADLLDALTEEER